MPQLEILYELFFNNSDYIFKIYVQRKYLRVSYNCECIYFKSNCTEHKNIQNKIFSRKSLNYLIFNAFIR